MDDVKENNESAINNLLKNILNKICILEENHKLIIDRLNNIENQIPILKEILRSQINKKDIDNIEELLRLLTANQLITNIENQINYSKAEYNDINKRPYFNILGYLNNDFRYPEIYRIKTKHFYIENNSIDVLYHNKINKIIEFECNIIDNCLDCIFKRRIKIYKDYDYHIIYNEKEITKENQPEYSAGIYFINNYDL